MRKQMAALCRRLAALLDTAGDGRLLVRGSADAPGTYAIDVSWMVLDRSPCEDLPELYIDGERIPPELPSSDGGDAPPDEMKGETDKP